MEQHMTGILVRGHVGKRLKIGRVVLWLCVVAAAVVILFHKMGGLIALVIALALTAVVEIVLSVRRRNRRWVEDTGSGFIVEDSAGRRQYADEDVYNVDLHLKRIYSEGVLKSMRREFVAKVEAENGPLEMVNDIPTGEEDPLGPLIGRLITNYRTTVRDALDSGAVVSGKGWSLTSSAFTIEGKSAEAVSWSDIDSIAELDQCICIWKRGVNEAICRIPVGSQNSYILHVILADYLESQGPRESRDSGVGMGRVLFERRGSKFMSLFLMLVGLILGIAGLTAIVAFLAGGDWSVLLTGVLISALSSILLYCGRRLGSSVFRCHERGVYRKAVFSGARELYYEEVVEFVYSATRQYYEGAYIGTALNIKLIPGNASGKKPITFSKTVKTADEGLDQLRDHISALIAVKMLSQLRDGARVTWTPNMTLTAEGIEFRPSGLIRRKEQTFLPYERVQSYDVQDGTFYLWEQGKDKPVMQESVTQPNFYPGFFAISQIFNPPEAG
jgi:membrane protein implicated in regulation of membrane protease activity